MNNYYMSILQWYLILKIFYYPPYINCLSRFFPEGKKIDSSERDPNNYKVQRQFCNLFTVALYMYMCIKFAPVK